jgi:hypothetical protein
MARDDSADLATLKVLLSRGSIERTGRTEHQANVARAGGKVVAFFSGMGEPQRRRLAPEIQRWHKQLLIFDPGATRSEDERLDLGLTFVAVAATASLSELQKLGRLGASAMVCQAIVERGVPWVQEAVEITLEKSGTWMSIGGVAHGLARLVAEGRIPAPRHDHYAIGIAYGYLFPGSDRRLVDAVRADLSWIEPAIWRQFEVEGGGEISLANFDKYLRPKAGGSWAETLLQLSREGRLDRQRLLDASLDALNRGFSQFRAGWFSRFHEQLQPALDERVTRIGRYADLLGSPLGPTVSLAISALTKAQKAGRLNPEPMLERIEPALFSKTAATVKAALALMAHAAGQCPGRAAAIVRCAASALEHPKVEIQTAAVALIEQAADHLDGAARAAIENRIDVVSPSLRPRVAALVGQSVPARATQFTESPADESMADIESAAAALPRDLRRLAGVDNAVDATATLPLNVPRAVFNGMEVPRLADENRIAPIETFEELIDQALVAIEHPEDLDRVEQVLAGALAFAADRPVNVAELLSPLARSMKRYRQRSHDGSCWATPRGALQIVLAPFISPEPIRFSVAENDPRAAIMLRTNAMADAIDHCTPRSQMSAPTHRGFWIDPLVLVERSMRAASKDAPPMLGIADQGLSLLRLAPDRRSEALAAAAKLEGEWGAALRYALGGGETVGKTDALWVASARARTPFDIDAQLAARPGKGVQGADLPPAFTACVSYRQVSPSLAYASVTLETDAADQFGFGKGSLRSHCGSEQPNATVAPEKCLTTVSLCDPATLGRLDTYHEGNMFHAGTWALALWPQHPEPVFALAALSACMLDGNAYFRPANEPLADGLKLILEPDVPVGPMALFMLCRGLNAIDTAAAEAAVDALIALIDDGRLDGETLGTAMHDFLMTGLVFGKRWPERLMQVARTSPLALLAVRRAVERALHPGEPQRKLRDLHAWLELLFELCTETGETVSDPLAREGISALAKAGKAKSAARAVLSITSSPNDRLRAAAARHAVRQRSARARRWASRIG